MRLDKQMWTALKLAAVMEKCKTNDLCTLIYLKKEKGTTLSAAVRQFLVLYYLAASTEEGHSKAGHGNFTRMLAKAKLKETEKVEFMKSCTVNRSLCVSCSLNEKCHRGKKKL